MDDLQRRRMRLTAKWLHKIAQLIIGILLILRIFWPELMAKWGDVVVNDITERSLRTAAHALSNTILTGSWERSHDIADFLPPSDPARLDEWAKAVDNYFDQEIAIFHYDGKTVRWQRLPDHYAGIKDRIETLLKSGITCTPAAPSVLRKGTFFVQPASFDTLEAGKGEAGTDQFSAMIAGTEESPVRWGIMYEFKDSIYPFVRRMEKLKIDGSVLSEMSVIDGMFHMRRPPNNIDKDSVETLLYGLRIYQTNTDSLLFTTPDLDTTNFKYTYKLGRSSFPWWLEVYDSDIGEQRRQDILEMIGKPSGKLPWMLYAAYSLFLMFVLAMLYRYVLKATKPE